MSYIIFACYVQLEIRIPLVKLSFASKSGLKRIPKKRPAERAAGDIPVALLPCSYAPCVVYLSYHVDCGAGGGPSDAPDSKRQKTHSGMVSKQLFVKNVARQ